MIPRTFTKVIFLFLVFTLAVLTAVHQPTGGVTFNPSSLSVRGKDNTITGNLDASSGTLNFFLSNGIPVSSTLLNVNGNADISNSTVNLHLDGGASSLGFSTVGNTLNLISVTGGNLTATSFTTGAHAFIGISFQHIGDTSPA
ncbi:hypothetical protein AGMMS50243_27280 [Betaproteobacteria bacterium]|nr:hypothetical protein AGMMS50243_27280 [Betaproteobacteria bacterium]